MAYIDHIAPVRATGPFDVPSGTTSNHQFPTPKESR